MSTEPKKQHFVSRCYLKAFGFGSKKHRKVRVIDLNRGNSFISNIKDIAESKHFNSLPTTDLQTNELEFLIGDIEEKAAPALDRLRETGNLEHESIDASICFMSMFAVRSPFVRSILDSVLSDIGASALNEVIATHDFSDPDDPTIPADLVKLYVKASKPELKPTKRLLIASELKMVIKLTELLKTRQWSLIDARHCNNDFITSDRPVVLFPTVLTRSSTILGDVGFNTPESIVHFPVSPKLALHGTLEGYEYDPAAVTNDLVARYNSKTIERAGSQIYYAREKFELFDGDDSIVDQSWLINKLRVESV